MILGPPKYQTKINTPERNWEGTSPVTERDTHPPGTNPLRDHSSSAHQSGTHSPRIAAKFPHPHHRAHAPHTPDTHLPGPYSPRRLHSPPSPCSPNRPDSPKSGTKSPAENHSPLPFSPDPTQTLAEMSSDEEHPDPMTAFMKKFKDTLEDIGANKHINVPQFRGKKGEDPIDYCLKVDDYFKAAKIAIVDQREHFKDTLFEKARRWENTLADMVNRYDYDDDDTDAQKKTSAKWLFLQRFAKEGRTIESAYEAWRILNFNPETDDIEDFLSKVKELAKKLGYADSAQIMTIKGCMPRDVYGLCLTKATLEELQEFLMDLFSNPRMKKTTSVNSPGEVSAFSMGQYADTVVVSATSSDIGKIKQDINNLQYNVQKMSAAGPRNRIQNKPWKPEVTPPRRRGGSSRGNFRGSRTDFQNRQNRLRGTPNNGNGNRYNPPKSETNANNSYRGKGNSFRGNSRGRGRGRYDSSPNVRRPRVASKTVDKDKGRCYYCHKFGHFISECQKKTEDEKGDRRFNSMRESQNNEYKADYDCYAAYDTEYEDDVFAILHVEDQWTSESCNDLFSNDDINDETGLDTLNN